MGAAPALRGARRRYPRTRDPSPRVIAALGGSWAIRFAGSPETIGKQTGKLDGTLLGGKAGANARNRTADLVITNHCSNCAISLGTELRRSPRKRKMTPRREI